MTIDAMGKVIGRGEGVAALINGRAKRVTPRVVRALQQALPDALVLVSDDFDQARRHVRLIAEANPRLVLSGGGDGASARLLNLLRAEARTNPQDGGHGTDRPFPTLGILKLGTGNAWASVTGAPAFQDLLPRLSRIPWDPPTERFDLIEVEGQLCPFTGVGWDAGLINDYYRNLDKRSSQLIGSRIATRLHKGLYGYMYALFRSTVPNEFNLLQKHGQARIVIENLSGEAFTLDSDARPLSMGSPHDGQPHVLYEGPLSVGAVGTEPEWGFGFRAFPKAKAMPGRINVRVYDRPVLEAVANMNKLWKGNFPQAGMHDFFVKHARMRFSRPMPFQMAGDAMGNRHAIEVKVADQDVRLVDWKAALRGERS